MALLDATSTAKHGWFRLYRHDDAPSEDDTGTDEATETVTSGDDDEAARLLADATQHDDTGTDEATETVEDPEGADQLGDKGKKALDAMKARIKAERERASKELATLRKQAAEQAARLAEFEDQDKTEKEKLTARAERSDKLAAEATARAVKAEVRALSVDAFADPSDAADVLTRDTAKYVGADGDIDVDAIRTDLEDLLERKPHWRKPEPVTPVAESKKPVKPKPKPDPSQGGRGDKPTDFRTVDRDAVDAQLRSMGVRVTR
jgi:hypothetical protein